MAKFLDTQAISNELMKLIKEAKDRIILVSYSFKVNLQIQERLKTKSKVGTLSEIVIVYGKTELKNSDLDWMKEIQDLKLYEKDNLHAKCYLNEEKAIICSMNLYEYSQQNNIEMGILITRKEDADVYSELLEEINNIKINGIRKAITDFEKDKNDQTINSNYQEEPQNKIIEEYKHATEFTIEQKLNARLLAQFQYSKSKMEKTNAYQILSDEEIIKIVSHPILRKNSIYEILPKINAIKYASDIIEYLNHNRIQFTIGMVTNTWYQTDESKYDRVKLKILNTGEEKWYDTTEELPKKNSVVAVKLNDTWFNQYFYL